MTEQQIKDVQKTAIKAAGEWVKSKGITAGLTGDQHAGILVNAVKETGLELTTEDLLNLFFTFKELENGSALRQKLEKGDYLKATVGKVASMAEQYI